MKILSYTHKIIKKKQQQHFGSVDIKMKKTAFMITSKDEIFISYTQLYDTDISDYFLKRCTFHKKYDRMNFID
jgi:hypothetical protein